MSTANNRTGRQFLKKSSLRRLSWIIPRVEVHLNHPRQHAGEGHAVIDDNFQRNPIQNHCPYCIRNLKELSQKSLIPATTDINMILHFSKKTYIDKQPSRSEHRSV